MKKKFCLIVVSVLVSSVMTGCQKNQAKTFKKIKTLKVSCKTKDLTNRKKVKISYNVDGSPKEVTGQISLRKVKNASDAASVLMSTRKIFKITGKDFYCIGKDTGRKKYDLYFLGQLYKGIPVEKGFFNVYVTKKGKTVSISGQYQRGIHLSVDPKLSKKQALEHVKAGHHKGAAKLVVYPKGNGILAYKCSIKDNYNHILAYTYIDAHTGKQIAKQQVQYNL